MSKQQREQLDAILRQGGSDSTADVTTVRAAFDALTARSPIPADLTQTPVTIGGVSGIEVTLAGGKSDAVILYFHSGV